MIQGNLKVSPDADWQEIGATAALLGDSREEVATVIWNWIQANPQHVRKIHDQMVELFCDYLAGEHRHNIAHSIRRSRGKNPTPLPKGVYNNLSAKVKAARSYSEKRWGAWADFKVNGVAIDDITVDDCQQSRARSKPQTVGTMTETLVELGIEHKIQSESRRRLGTTKADAGYMARLQDAAKSIAQAGLSTAESRMATMLSQGKI